MLFDVLSVNWRNSKGFGVFPPQTYVKIKNEISSFARLNENSDDYIGLSIRTLINFSSVVHNSYVHITLYSDYEMGEKNVYSKIIVFNKTWKFHQSPSTHTLHVHWFQRHFYVSIHFFSIYLLICPLVPVSFLFSIPLSHQEITLISRIFSLKRTGVKKITSYNIYIYT